MHGTPGTPRDDTPVHISISRFSPTEDANVDFLNSNNLRVVYILISHIPVKTILKQNQECSMHLKSEALWVKENDKSKSGVKINEVVGQKNSSSER